MLNCLRRYSAFVDPHLVRKYLMKSASSKEILECFEHQKSVFTIQNHGSLFIKSLSKLKPTDAIKETFRDSRFKDFLAILSKEPLFDAYLNTFLSLSFLYKSLSIPMNNDLKDIFIKKLSTNMPNLNISQSSKALLAISLNLNSNPELLTLGKEVLDKILKIVGIQIPSVTNCDDILWSCIQLYFICRKDYKKEIFDILEPYIIRDCAKAVGGELVNILKSYCAASKGSKDFFQNLVLQILMKSHSLKPIGTDPHRALICIETLHIQYTGQIV
jgi:hypothetical protein